MVGSLGRFFLMLSVLFCFAGRAQAQDGGGSQEVNQLLATGTKVNYAHEKWRYSGEFQIRLDQNYRRLNVWYIEGVVTNLTFKHLELAPDLRFSVKPKIFETRPGFGIILKTTAKNWQVALQHKYQADIPSEGTTGHGVRQVLFVNARASEKLIASLLGGWLYRWRGDFADFEFWRAGGGVTYIFDPFRTLNVSYFLGWENDGVEWRRSGFLLVQLSLSIRNDWLYVPAKIVNF